MIFYILTNIQEKDSLLIQKKPPQDSEQWRSLIVWIIHNILLRLSNGFTIDFECNQ